MSRRVGRRDVLRGMAGLGVVAAAAPLMAACGGGAEAPSAAPTEAPVPMPTTAAGGERVMSRVAFVKTQSRSEGVRQALRLLSPDGVRGKRLLLKPNLNSADPSPGSTHPDTLRALAEWLLDGGAAHVAIGDRSGMGQTRSVMEGTGVIALAEELGLETVAFEELDESSWDVFRPQESHWADGFAVPRLLSEVDAVIQTCNLKTHRFGGHFTMSLKNSVGLVARTVPGQTHNYMTELHSSPNQREMIAEINTAYAPELIVLDGVEAFTTDGPDKGTKVAAEVVLAATDRVALDAVGVALLRHWGTTPEVSEGPVFGQAQIARAVELGLGAASPEDIEIVTDDEPSREYAAQVRSVLIAG